ncbi:P-loop containing nucleoside triphosphate hydrolase protein [Periconia macrospinosa]|uniref:P-loop containing nucleoside triphosphate hydrolase protein n=1 Tax=Periconia macrospinosa TaxID=97972 RepID=A0A2V1D6K4_9PLEO|nr:P-loop containing nucleoside triphosphate hydrolase protein [Periconia macrospinosa]
MDTVELDPEVKKDILDDITQFIEPNRYIFYQRRGIRYKRGYLLFGPPGTGKSSFALACAGITRGKLYEVTLGRITNESFLRPLFKRPTKGDILLLEDIDAANIQRESVVKVDRLDKIIDNPISLSGLLSAIDAIPDGVILIMTTNRPQSLDEALIRSGRVDKRVLFGYANNIVAQSIFTRIYKDDKKNTVSSEVAELSRRFAEKIPLETVTPADVQGFLLEKSDPQSAVDDIDGWIKKVVEAKEKRRKHFESLNGESAGSSEDDFET